MSATVAPPASVEAPPADLGLGVEEFYALRDRGVFGATRVDLLDGQLHFEMPESYFHAAIITLLLRLLRPFEDDGFFAYPEASVEIDGKSAPQPDVFVTRRPPEKVTRALGEAKSGDVVLVIEVSLTSLAKDRGPKSRKYASAGIPEYWIVDPERRRVEVRRDPQEGEYQSTTVSEASASLRPLLNPAREIIVSSIFPDESGV